MAADRRGQMGADSVQADGNARAQVIEQHLVFLGRVGVFIVLRKSGQAEKGARGYKEDGEKLFHTLTVYNQGKYTYFI